MSNPPSAAVHVEELSPGDLLEPGFFPRLNAAALAHEPCVYIVRNDGFARGVPLPLAFANPCLVDLAPAFRLRGARVHSEAELAALLPRARALCARGHGPFWIEVLVASAPENPPADGD